MKKKLLRIVTGMMLSALVCFVGPIQAMADTGAVTFGSESYEYGDDESFPIGVYITGDETIGTYYVEASYDNRRMKYVSGAEEANNEILILKGTATGEEVKYMLYFEPLSGGPANIKIDRAMVMTADSDNQLEFNITTLGTAPITISGADTVGEIEEPIVPADPVTPDDTEDPQVGTITDQVTPDEGLSVSPEMLPSEGETDVETDKAGISKLLQDYLYIALFVVLVIAVVIVAMMIRILYVKRQRRLRRERQQAARLAALAKEKENVSGTVNTDVRDKKLQEKQLGRPVISVQNVTMKYKIASCNTSGLKDYLIQKIKGQISYRELMALDQVSFNIYKGEVVGIVGTNGSGKSTLLKIVTGVLRPTTGKVRVDKKKIQLLTLGTGFDMELTAKENVYLNGSIIGLTKEFIDQKYNEIVEFAELEGFMDEKVKNFSSGMVSRLGFAIATIGDVADILILDEVLAVGDEFFRKKSMAKVKELIHGGATVLIVSHSMQTIVENCTKAVWLEKGKLRMIGEPKEVSKAYQKYGMEMRLNRKVDPEQYVLQYKVPDSRKWELANNKVWQSVVYSDFEVLRANGKSGARVFLELDKELEKGSVYGYVIKYKAITTERIRVMFTEDTSENGRFSVVSVIKSKNEWQEISGEFSSNMESLKYLMLASTDFKGESAMITFESIRIWKE